jgi:hypothetical protein
MVNIILINNFMQANAMSLDYYSKASLSYQQDFLVPFVQQKNIANNKKYYEQVLADLSTKQFDALGNIMNAVRTSALNNKKFPLKKVQEQAKTFGNQADEIVKCAQAMYQTIIEMKKDPNFAVSIEDFNKRLEEIYVQSQNIPQAAESPLLLREFTRAEAGVRAIIQLEDPPYDPKLQKIGSRLGGYNVICSITPTQQNIFMLVADTFYSLMFRDINASQKDKLQFILRKNYGQKDGTEIFEDILLISANINKIPAPRVMQAVNLQDTDEENAATATTDTNSHKNKLKP